MSKIIYHEDDHVGFIKINNPTPLTCLSSLVLHELSDFLTQKKSAGTLRALVFTGEGKAFIAGGDIKQMQSMNSIEAAQFSALGNKVMNQIQHFTAPTIAAVNGYALGGGLELTLSCDFAYASSAAKFALPEVSLGLIPGFGGNKRLYDRIGMAKAKELIYTGRMISAEEALSLGIINKITPADELMNEVAKVLAELKKVSLNAIKQSKELLNLCNDLPKDALMQYESDKFGLLFSHPDAHEGLNAFVEKRKAEWTYGNPSAVEV